MCGDLEQYGVPQLSFEGQQALFVKRLIDKCGMLHRVDSPVERPLTATSSYAGSWAELRRRNTNSAPSLGKASDRVVRSTEHRVRGTGSLVLNASCAAAPTSCHVTRA
jgi:hypothetical protein